ncbi:MAG TPA: protein kinase [Kofleriaceae bacterium]|nr:protein kinase [Kofleriaceae bacterium]
MQTCRLCDAHSTDDLRYCGSCGEPLRDDVAPRPRSRPSEVIPAGTEVGSYRLLDVLGEGGMGRVYLAEHIRLGRKVALKMLRSKYSQNPEAVRRFFTEARAVNRIAHENIVEVTDFVSEPDGASYYIMEFLTGHSLYEVLNQERHLPLQRALAIAGQVANALAAVHEAGIVHRDLKPDNIFLAQRGTRTDLVKLLDFGIAKLVEPGLDISVQRTGVGTLMGTPAYMSPEQASAAPVDYRSDIYALGVILYELATGVVPFQGGSYGEILVQHLTHPPRKPSTFDDLPHPVPADLERLILHCLAKDVARRPQSMREVEEKLRAIQVHLVRGESMLTGATWPSMPRISRDEIGQLSSEDDDQDDDQPPTSRKRRRLLLGATALALAGAAVSAWLIVPGLLGADDPDHPGRRARMVGHADRADQAAPPGGAATLPPDSAATATPSAPPAGSSAAEPARPSSEPITVTIHSSPNGAEVFLAGQEAPLGLTPFETQVDRSDDQAEFEIRKPGFAPVRQSVKLVEDVFISVGLSPSVPERDPESRAPSRQAKPRVVVRRGKPVLESPRDQSKPDDKRLEKSGVIDAFEQ